MKWLDLYHDYEKQEWRLDGSRAALECLQQAIALALLDMSGRICVDGFYEGAGDRFVLSLKARE